MKNNSPINENQLLDINRATFPIFIKYPNLTYICVKYKVPKKSLRLFLNLLADYNLIRLGQNGIWTNENVYQRIFGKEYKKLNLNPNNYFLKNGVEK